GDYSYTDFDGNLVTQNFDNDTFTWMGRLNSRITLPGKIDWQTNVMYRGPQPTAQGKSLATTSPNMALIKELFNDRATLAGSAEELVNLRKWMAVTAVLPALTYSEMQWRERSVNVTFTHRLSLTKAERQNQRRRQGAPSEDMEEMM